MAAIWDGARTGYLSESISKNNAKYGFEVKGTVRDSGWFERDDSMESSAPGRDPGRW